MSVTIGSAFHGHWVRTYTTTVYNGMASTSTSDSFESGSNDYGQAGVKIVLFNESEKEIKYIDFHVVAINRVRDTIGNVIGLRACGPVARHSRANFVWDYIWDSSTIYAVIVLDLTIEYFDGSIEKQAISPKPDEKQLWYDGAVAYPLNMPVCLAVATLVGVIGRRLKVGRM